MLLSFITGPPFGNKSLLQLAEVVMQRHFLETSFHDFLFFVGNELLERVNFGTLIEKCLTNLHSLSLKFLRNKYKNKKFIIGKNNHTINLDN